MVVRSAGLVVAVAVLAAACGGGDAAAPGSGESGGDVTTASTVPDWEEPATYEYELQSDCGERTLLGRYRITVTDGEVTDVAAGDDQAAVVVGDDELREAVPTLGELLEEAREAEAAGADVVNVETDGDPAGRPGLIEIDHDLDADDDEACYVVTAFEDLTTPREEAAPSQPRVSGDLPQLPPRASWPVSLEGPPPCEDDAACEDGFVIGEVFYGAGCTRVLEEFVTEEAIADGPDAVHVIDGVDPLALVAQRGPAQSCDEFEDPPEGLAWHMAFGPAALNGSVVCRVGDLTDRQVRANGC